jgi:hypothetical protein
MSSGSAVERDAVAEYVADVRATLEESPSMSARTAELRVTQPLLELLGWDLQGGAVAAGYRTEGEAVSFALQPGERPRALVETVAPADELAPDDVDRLLAAMRAEGIGRALLLDGHDLAVVTLSADGRKGRRVSL